MEDEGQDAANENKDSGDSSIEENESKDQSGRSIEDDKTLQKREPDREVTFIELQKNVRSMNSSDRVEELICEVRDCKWDALLISESWKPEKDAPRSGVRILLNRKWKNKINWADYLSERNIAKSITVNSQSVLLMSVYFPHSGYADHHIEKAYRAIEKDTKSKRAIRIVGDDFNAELGPGIGVERITVGPHTLKEGEGNRRGDWKKQWMMLQKLCAVNTIYRKPLEKQATYKTPNCAEKQLDYILIDRKHRSCSRDAEAHDMIHMESDHRTVMARFVIEAWKERPRKAQIEGSKQTTMESARIQDDGKDEPDGENVIDERYQEG